MNYFFVFQNKSYIGEYKGNFLWAPKFNEKGHKKSFWESMKNVEAGDVIFSSVDKQIRAIAVAQRSYIEAPSPLVSMMICG